MEKVNLSADGQLSREVQNPEVLEIIIDARQLSRGTEVSPDKPFREQSEYYRLEKFEPQQDGTCVARYVRVNADEN